MLEILRRGRNVIFDLSLFQSDESQAAASKCLVKVAEMAATLGEYEKAIRIYEQVNITNDQSRKIGKCP